MRDSEREQKRERHTASILMCFKEKTKDQKNLRFPEKNTIILSAVVHVLHCKFWV